MHKYFLISLLWDQVGDSKIYYITILFSIIIITGVYVPQIKI